MTVDHIAGKIQQIGGKQPVPLGINYQENLMKMPVARSRKSPTNFNPSSNDTHQNKPASRTNSPLVDNKIQLGIQNRMADQIKGIMNET